jgi:D-alanyl-D-alanine carboxypeptidase
MSQENIPRAIVGIQTPDDAYVRAFGVSDKATASAMQPDLSMRIGSVTKTFTVTAVLQLVDGGRVGLDDPISKYKAGVPEGDRITIRQLAGMRSGLFSYTDDAGFQEALLSNPHRSFSPEQLLQYAFSHPPHFEPGTGFEYSNTNTVLLGQVVETVAGVSLADYLHQHILAPLHLDHTALPRGSELPDPHAHDYTERVSPGQPVDATDWDPSWAGAAGAMFSNLDDLHVWAAALATGRLLSPSSQAQRHHTVPFVGGPPGSSYGLGVIDFSGWIGHGGNLPGYTSLVVYLPAQQMSLVILVNTDSSAEPAMAPNLVLGNAVTAIISPANVIPPAADSE